MILPKLERCPCCEKTGNARLEDREDVLFPARTRKTYRVICSCGARSPWACTALRAVEVWNEMENPLA